MSNTVQSFSVGYNPINESNIFTSGDFITGKITLELGKDCKIDELLVKLKGKAEVDWSESNGDKVKRYHDKEMYFTIEQSIIRKGQDLPPSFKGTRGKVVYSLEAILGRPMKLDSKAKAKFTFMHKQNLNSDPMLMTPQNGTKEKKLKLFASGTVSLDVNVERTGFYQGEGIKIVAAIQNKTSRDIKPKYCLYKKDSYFAKNERRVETKEILKEVGEAIPPSASQTVTRIITIPPTTAVSILNCNILKVEYRLKLYLDVKYASDPEVKFPIIILPALQQGSYGEHQSAYPTYGFEAFPSPDMPGGSYFPQNPTASGSFAAPPSYGTYGMYTPT